MNNRDRERLQQVIDRLVTYRDTSTREAHRLFERKRRKDAYGRSCEASALNVCISMLEDFERVEP